MRESGDAGGSAVVIEKRSDVVGGKRASVSRDVVGVKGDVPV